MNANPAGTDTGNPSSQVPGVAEIAAQLRRMIVEELDVRIQEEVVTDDVPLLEGGLALDSIVLFEFITLIEKRFGFEFADQSLNMELFANLTVLAQHIHEARSRHAQAVAS